MPVDDGADRVGRSSRRRILAITAIVFLVALTLILKRSNHAGAPYSVADLGAKVTLAAAPGGGGHTVTGELTFVTQTGAPKPGVLALFVIDRSTGKAAGELTGSARAGSPVHVGWDRHYDQISKQVSWLSALTPVGSTPPASAVSFAPSTVSPITFTAVLAGTAPAVTEPARDLTVALVFLDPQGHVYWATNLTS